GFPRDLHPFPTRRSSDLDIHRAIGWTGIPRRGENRRLPIETLAEPLHPFLKHLEVQVVRAGRGGCGELHAESLGAAAEDAAIGRSEEHTSELQSRFDLVC